MVAFGTQAGTTTLLLATKALVLVLAFRELQAPLFPTESLARGTSAVQSTSSLFAQSDNDADASWSTPSRRPGTVVRDSIFFSQWVTHT
jgi:hypothetical protein